MLDPKALQELRAQLQGAALVPGDDGYDRARQTWDATTFDQKPALVVLPEISADVMVAVTFARRHNLAIAVQGGGHGHPLPADGALLINFTRMKAVSIAPETAGARVEPGALAGDLTAAAQPFGLAPLIGFSASVGFIGYLLGGGIGWLTRQYGPGAASLRSVELVTADGELLQVDAQSHPDLFWGLHGGGGNFGIVTALECELYSVDHVFGGQVFYPSALGQDVVRAYLQWADTVPDELTSALRIMQMPPAPDIPAAIRGQTVIMVLACFTGSTEEGERLLQAMRSLGTPLLDTFASIPYAQVGTIAGDPPESPPLLAHSAGGALRGVSAPAIETLLAVATDSTAGIFLTEIRHLGGALARQPEDAMPFGLREAPFYLSVRAFAPAPEVLAQGKAAISKLMAAVEPDLTGETLVNFLDYNVLDAGNGGETGTRTAYSSANYQRLAAVKAMYDPDNVFRFTHNILPARG